MLTRGYSMVQDREGEVIRSVSQVEIGQRVDVKLSDGSFSATVMDKKENGQ